MARMPWIIAGITAVALTITASATALSVGPAGLGAGTAPIGTCDGDGVTFRYGLDAAGNVTRVTVANVDAGCQGGTLRVTLVNAGSVVGSGSLSLPSSGPWAGAYELAVSPTPASSLITGTHAAIEGP